MYFKGPVHKGLESFVEKNRIVSIFPSVICAGFKPGCHQTNANRVE